jgi:hypothetical protein
MYRYYYLKNLPEAFENYFVTNNEIHNYKTRNANLVPRAFVEDEGRDEKALVWAGHVTTQKIAVFDSYSSRSGEIFFNEIYKSSKQINSQKTSQSILFMYSEVWHESAVISEDPHLCFLRYTDISSDFQPQAKLHPSCI